jgi:hypothetical protein
MRYEFKLGAKDRAQYGGPEWVPFDPDELAQMTYDELAELERDILTEDHLSLASLLAYHWPLKTALGFRGAHWIARQLAGITEPEWAQFKPNTLATDYRTLPDPAEAKTAPDDDGDGEAIPPDGSSPPPSGSDQ